MLVLTRKTNQCIRIGENITVTVLEVKGSSVRVGIDAPRDVKIMRLEALLRDQMQTDAVFASNALSTQPASGSEQLQPPNSSPVKASNSLPVSNIAPLAQRTKPRAQAATMSSSWIRPPQRLGPGSLRGLMAYRR